MTLKTGFSALGALLPAAGIAATYFAMGAGWDVLLVTGGVAGALILISYIVAAAGADSTFGEFMRGWLIGVNAALNAAFGYALVSVLGGPAAGAAAGGVLGAINLLCVLAPVSQNGFFQGMLGWLNWLMPMSWLIVSLGVGFSLFSLLLHAVTAGKVDYLRIQAVGMDWKTGTLFLKGGLVANLNPIDTAFNMGNFSFVDYRSGGWHMEHEAGHTLNLAAFGCVFHLIGALDENVLRRGANAYAERIAESNSTGQNGSNIPMWS